MRAFQFAVTGVAAAVPVGYAIEPAVRQASLDSWQAMPVEALGTHPVFSAMPMKAHAASPDVEARDDVSTRLGAYCRETTFFGNCADSDDVV
ncbi:hypothetical protein [Comamonas testosteroni]|uniref:Uncharacterized protein n=1 Tax=Comamonas testosteroni TaxID=285 RepID=A0A8B4S3V2_COMTE|nr:hypothetical protein [Comamonas testosteroni]EHN63477.1 hypothetical protein CTATCC11996_22832 [Comamonas testosteroni ATCC 11996]QQN69400.1 hypothetical protein IYN88_22370 [Comamonas testosteroni]SUY77208.1 Uncharacterised protein [Comamonas testosteroni]